MTDEDQRALAWQASRRRREANARAVEQRSRGQEGSRLALLRNWEPVISWLRERVR